MIDISKTLTKFRLFFFVGTILLVTAGITSAQTDSVRKKRLRNPSTVNGSIGGEAHDSYVIRARKGQTIKVQISWKSADNNQAQFVISKSADFFSGEVLEGGIETYDGRTKSRKAPATGNYYIYVTAHPAADYTLKASVK